MRHPSRVSRRAAAGLVVGVLLLVVVAVLVLRSDEDGEVRIVRGVPDAGFPLRGPAAGDEATIRSAAEAWVRRERRDDDARWARADDPEVTVLWAGPTTRGRDGVVLVGPSGSGALLERLRGRSYWEVDGVVVERDDDPVVVASAGGILVREGTRDASYLVSEAPGPQAAPVREVDGFWHRTRGALPDGALLLPGGLRTRFTSAGADVPPAALVVGQRCGTGCRPRPRQLTPTLLRRLQSDRKDLRDRSAIADAARMDAQRLVAAAAAEEDDAPPVRPSAPPVLDLVADRLLPPVGPVVVLSRTPSPGAGSAEDRRPTLVAAAGGSTIANDDETAAVAVPLGGRTDRGDRAARGPAFGAAYVRQEVLTDDPASSADDDREPRVQGPWLLVAGGRDVASAEVRAGRRELAVDLPVGLVRASWLPRDDTSETTELDVGVLGRTRSGAFVAPAGPSTSVSPIRAREAGAGG